MSLADAPQFSIIHARSYIRWVAGLSISLVFAAYVLTQISLHVYGRTLGGSEHGLVQLFDMRLEANLPTMLAALLFALSSLVVFAIASHHRHRGEKASRYWGFLAAALLFLSIDEGGELHERLSFLIWRFYQTEGALHDAWLIPYALLLVAGGAFFWPFLRHLPRDTRTRFASAGVVFVSGAFGMEMIEGYYETNQGNWLDAGYAVLVGVEELAELIGLAMFNDAALRHLSLRMGVHSVRLAAEDRAV